ncbi:MAG: hypothetical protein Q4B73_00805 [Lachnospiraceae bacterium]|nr:hypothetical protein [Lachnospiraceae bacterium]
MLKTMIRKQLLEVNQFYFMDRKTNQQKPKGKIAATIVLFVVIFLFVGAAFLGVSFMLGDALISNGVTWLYFALMGIMSIILGTFGSVFNTYAGLYQAKDNEMLLSMPIAPSHILISRMVGVYVMGLLYTGIVWFPATIVYYIFGRPTLFGVIAPIILLFAIVLLVTVLTCLLGWVVALASGRAKNRSLVTIVVSVVGFLLYYYVCFRLNALLQSLLLYADQVGDVIQGWIYPIYQLGVGAAGDVKGFLIFIAISVAAFAICCFVMAKSFIKIVTRKAPEKKAVYKETTLKTSTVSSALLHRELLRFKSSPIYALNCGLGLVLGPVLAVIAFVKREMVMEVLSGMSVMLPLINDIRPILAVGAICLIAGMNCVAAPSVALEGHSLWIVRSLPVETDKVLKAKLQLHVRLNILPAVFGAVMMTLAFGGSVDRLVAGVILTIAFVVFSGAMDLSFGLKNPTLDWSSEVVPVKQSGAVMLSLFVGWGVVLAMTAACVGLTLLINANIAMIVVAIVLILLSRLLEKRIYTKGAEAFEKL